VACSGDDAITGTANPDVVAVPDVSVPEFYIAGVSFANASANSERQLHVSWY